MAKLIATIKAIITRLMFGAHGFIAIWQVTQFKKNPFYWYLSVPMLLLFFEGIFTLTIKKNQEWKWFCPSVFLYLGSVVPSIWLLELDKVDKRLMAQEESFNMNMSMSENLKELGNLLGGKLKLPEINVSADMWVTLIEQFLMLILIIGRWMLPKGELTRDQLSQLLLVYIGTAADIIEFFDSFKDEKINTKKILAILTLSIWSWSLMQFTVVLTATKSRKSRLSTSSTPKDTQSCCCNIDVWGIVLNITLQDAPFLTFRLLIIIHYEIISYMNIFFTCKNTLVIVLQLYRLYVVYSENRHKPKKKAAEDFELTNISIISNSNMSVRQGGRSGKKNAVGDKSSGNARRFAEESGGSSENDELMEYDDRKNKKLRKQPNTRKDTGYSTGSSHTSARTSRSTDEKHRHGLAKQKQPKKPTSTSRTKKKEQSDSEPDEKKYRKQRKREPEPLSEESDECSEVEETKSMKKKSRNSKDMEEGKKSKKSSQKNKSVTESNSSSEE